MRRQHHNPPDSNTASGGGFGAPPQHTRGTGHCIACGPSLRDCVLCGAEKTVHRILSTGELYCSNCGHGRSLASRPEVTAQRRAHR